MSILTAPAMQLIIFPVIISSCIAVIIGTIHSRIGIQVELQQTDFFYVKIKEYKPFVFLRESLSTYRLLLLFHLFYLPSLFTLRTSWFWYHQLPIFTFDLWSFLDFGSEVTK